MVEWKEKRYYSVTIFLEEERAYGSFFHGSRELIPGHFNRVTIKGEVIILLERNSMTIYPKIQVPGHELQVNYLEPFLEIEVKKIE